MALPRLMKSDLKGVKIVIMDVLLLIAVFEIVKLRRIPEDTKDPVERER